jgi:hypothetical protein
VAARRVTTELRHVLHEHDVTLIARVDDGVTSVAIETVEDGIGVAVTAAFERHPEGDGATGPLAVFVTEPEGILSLVVRIATGG